MSTRYNTGNPIESADVRDMSDNAKNFDLFSISSEDSFQDRLGVARKTLTGAVRDIGIPIVGDFTTGCTVTSVAQGVQEIGGSVYRWKGSLPKVVPPSSTPSGTGGISPSGDWVDVGDATVRASLISDGRSLEEIATIESRLYADDGYQLVGDSVIARLSTLKAKFGVAAWAQAANYKIFHIDIDDTKTTTYLIPAGQTVVLDGVVTHAVASDCFLAQSVNGWRLTGNGALNGGSLPTALDAAHIGLRVVNCFGYTIDGSIDIYNFRSNGACFDGSGTLTGPVSFSYVSGLRLHDNWINHSLRDGFPAEYTTFTGCWNYDAVSIAMVAQTGNISYIGGGITHSKGVGLYLQHPTSGGNPHHGMFVGTVFNHNAGAGILAEGVANGMQFIGCNIYHGGASNRGYIFLNSSRGINFVGGILACDVYCRESDGDPHLGWNSIRGMFVLEDTVGGVPVSGRIITGSTPLGVMTRRKLIVEDNFTNTGPWGFNAPGGLNTYAQAKPSAPIVFSSTYQNLTFSSIVSNNSLSYDPLTGFYTCQASGVLEANVSLELTTNTNATSAGDNIGVFYQPTVGPIVNMGEIPVVSQSATKARANGSYRVAVSKGDKVLLQYSAPSGVSFTTTIGVRSSISFRMV